MYLLEATYSDPHGNWSAGYSILHNSRSREEISQYTDL